MKALVLCGGMPQAYLVKLLKERGYTVVLADRNDDPRGPCIYHIYRQIIY